MRIFGFVYGVTTICFLKAAFGFTAISTPNPNDRDTYMRLRSIFAQNKYGYNTRFMSDFDLFLEGVLNERFIESSTLYYDDESVATEIEDMEKGLNGEFAPSDIANLVKDSHGHGAGDRVMRYPGRVGNNYKQSDDLSIYKTFPRGTKPSFWESIQGDLSWASKSEKGNKIKETELHLKIIHEIITNT